MTNDVKLEIGDELLLASIPLALVERGGAPYGAQKPTRSREHLETKGGGGGRLGFEFKNRTEQMRFRVSVSTPDTVTRERCVFRGSPHLSST